MGNLVDTFIISSKYEWMNRINFPTDKDLQAILKAVPEKYRIMLRALMVKFESLDRIMDNRDCDMAYEIFNAVDPYQTDNVMFLNRYRGDCLQQVIRKTFYETLLIIENDYNEEKYNFFIVVYSNHIIVEEHWSACLSEEQVVHKVVGSSEHAILNIHNLRH